MVEFLTTTGVSYNLERIVRDASEKLVLVSPYLKINDRLKQWLEDKNRFKIDIRVVYGKNELQPAENNWLRSMVSIRSSYCENLHAKCYLNESEALITSMNLYEFSQVNNEEMGVLIRKSDDLELYQQIYEDTNRLIRISKELRVEVQEVKRTSITSSSAGKKPTRARSSSKIKRATGGFCIRCGEGLTAAQVRTKKTLCRPHYLDWAEFKNEDHPEKFCTSSGKSRKTSFAKPQCRSCWEESPLNA